MTSNNRIIAIDFLRGFTIILMILVNNPGSWNHLFTPLSHAHWNGCTPTDLIYPFFIFIVGASIAFAMQGKKSVPQEHQALMLKIVKRGAIIIVLGILKDNFPFFTLEQGSFHAWLPDQWRIPGVLQRIGLVFIFTGILFVKAEIKTHILVLATLLLGYWWLINIDLPSAYIKNLNLPGAHNFSAWFDVQLLGKDHLWKYSRSEGWDPESLLGTLPAIGTCLLGLIAGQIIRGDKTLLNKIKTLAYTGLALTVLGLLWNHVFPINKSLWTSSYVLFSGGIALMFTALCLWIMDYKSYQRGTSTFLYFGSNAIVAYLGSEIVSAIAHLVPWDASHSLSEAMANALLSLFSSASYANIGSDHPDYLYAQLASHLYALLWLIPFYFVLRYLYQKKIFIKV
jgi:predicted acyltransferase